jgi:hypothetical protein
LPEARLSYDDVLAWRERTSPEPGTEVRMSHRTWATLAADPRIERSFVGPSQHTLTLTLDPRLPDGEIFVVLPGFEPVIVESPPKPSPPGS